MAYTTINKSTDYFNTKLYTGNGSANTGITGVGFQPDLLWIKERDSTSTHSWTDAVRGATKRIESSSTDNEFTTSDNVKSFDTDGFTVGTGGQVNENTRTYVAWNWKANGTGSANTDGTISATVSANTTSGFSIVSYDGTGSAGTLGHGLGVAPNFIIVKNLSDDGTNWFCYHSGIASDAETDYILLNATDGKVDNTYWNDTAPTSSVFSVGSQNDVNGSGGDRMIAYCFAEKKGFSKFGSYTGNGNANGTFIYTGFKPAFVISKCTSNAGEVWNLWDNKRDGMNGDNSRLFPDLNNAESEDSSPNEIDLLSNGFKLRHTNSGNNGSGRTYIYMAFGQSLVGSNNIPCTAR